MNIKTSTNTLTCVHIDRDAYNSSVTGVRIDLAGIAMGCVNIWLRASASKISTEKV